MSEKQYVILGQFKGRFYTEQSAVSDKNDRGEENTRSVRLFSGEFSEASELEKYSPEEYRNYDSLLTHNVDKVRVDTVAGSKIGGLTKHDFEQLLIIDPRYGMPDKINDKLYYDVQSTAVGITKKPIQKLKPPPPPVVTDNPHPDQGGTITPGKGGAGCSELQGCNANGCSGNGCSSPGCAGPGCAGPSMGCSSLPGCVPVGCAPFVMGGGCISLLLRLLGLLFMIMFLLWLFRSCNTDENPEVCDVATELKEEQRLLEERNQDLKKQRLLNIHKRVSLLQPVYYYRDGTESREISKENVDDLYEVLSDNEGLKLTFEGHSNGDLYESDDISYKRALSLKEVITGRGISPDRIIIIDRKDSVQLCAPSKMLYDKDNGNQMYNRNMRVKVLYRNYHEKK